MCLQEGPSVDRLFGLLLVVGVAATDHHHTVVTFFGQLSARAFSIYSREVATGIMATQLSVATTKGRVWNQFTLFYLDILSAPSFDLKPFLEGQGRDN